MPRYLVPMEESVSYNLVVEAESDDAARDAAYESGECDAEPGSVFVCREAGDPKIQSE